jgi:hypothetical protein
MIYCIWYPSGGFGHWINSIISLYGDNFQRPIGQLKFNSDGNSHNLPLVLEPYNTNIKDQFVLPPIDQNINYTLLIDNGIGDESDNFKHLINDHVIIKICYDDYTWPVIAQTCIIKAMNSSLEQEFAVKDSWHENVGWSQREKYFLTLRDHSYRYKWNSQNNCHCIQIDDLIDYDRTRQRIESFGIQLGDFRDLWETWWGQNCRYFQPVTVSRFVVDAIKRDYFMDLRTINDIWTQSVIYYYLWLEFDQEIPHNDYADFFSDTEQIKRCLKL